MKKQFPRDPDVLLQLLTQQQNQNVAQEKHNAEQQALIIKLMAQIEQMQQRMDKLLHMLYGTKSEKSPKKKSKESDDANKPVLPTNKASANTPKTKNGRSPLSADLPRVRQKHDIPEDKRYCNGCHTKLHGMGKVITEQLSLKPAEFFVTEHIRYKYACRCCQQVYTAELPPQPIDKGLADAGVLTEVTLNKYQDALPLYRQQQRFLRHGIEIPRSTLCDWVSQVALAFEPIVMSMKQDTLIPGKRIFTDDTTVPVLDKDKKGKAHTGRLWVYVGGGLIKPLCAIYDYTPTRSKSAPKRFLKGFTGFLQADAYPGYDEIYKTGDIIEIACWAHARRGFADIVKTTKKPGLANKAIDFIAELYAVEKTIKHLSPLERKYYRRKHSKTILKRFHSWLIRRKRKTLPKSPVGKAIRYALNHWRALCNYLRDGILEIDNNTSERAIKPLVIGRKNYLFAGSHEGAKRAAIIYSIIETCKLNGINAWDYMNDVLKRLPTTLNKDIKTLYPYNWAPKKQ